MDLCIDECDHRDYYFPCDFFLSVPNCEWREGSSVSGINCKSTCPGTETVGARYTFEMLLGDKLIKKNEPRFEADCFYVPISNSISLSECFLTVKNVLRDDKGRLACILYQDGTRLGGKNCTIKVLCKIERSCLFGLRLFARAQLSFGRRI